MAPLALVALLYTVLVLYALQGTRVVAELGAIAHVAVPLLAYFAVMWAAALAAARRLRWPYELAVTQAFTAASNNFELAIAVAVRWGGGWVAQGSRGRVVNFACAHHRSQVHGGDRGPSPACVAQVGTFGVDSQEALAATVGPLVEVLVLLGLVYVALWLRKRLAWPAGSEPAPRR